jgi:hypothetical protein
MALQFNPGNSDRSGELLAAASANAANTRLQGQQALHAGIGSAVQSVSGAAMGALQGYMEKGQAAQMAMGKAEAIQQIGQQYGLDTSMLPQLLQETKDPYRLNAMMDIYGSHLDQQMKNSYQNRGHELAMQRMAQQSQFTQGNQANAAALRPVQAPSPTRTQWGGFNVAPGIDMSR